MSAESFLGELLPRFDGVAKNLKIAQGDSQYSGRTSTLIVTDNCNLRCTYCYCTKTSKRMSWETAKKYIDEVFAKSENFFLIPIAEQTEMDHRKIWEFIGGEPLMESKLVFQCMDYIVEKTNSLHDNHPWKRKWDCKCGVGEPHTAHGYRFQIGTNGLMLHDREIRKTLEKWSKTGLVNLSVTLDGPKSMHDECRVDVGGDGSWERVVSIWPWMREFYPGGADSTKSTIAPENLHYMVNVVKFFIEKMDIKTINMNCVFENVWTRGEHLVLFDKLTELADWLIETGHYKTHYVRWFGLNYLQPYKKEMKEEGKKWCGAGTYMDACDYTGTVYPCMRFKHVGDEKVALGTLKDGFSRDRYAEMKPAMFTPKQKEIAGTDCTNCLTISGCADCQALGYQCFGEYDIKTPYICAFHRATVFANIYFFGRLLDFVRKDEKDYLMSLLDEYTKDAPFAQGVDNGLPVEG